jgi:hypothetical protein
LLRRPRRGVTALRPACLAVLALIAACPAAQPIAKPDPCACLIIGVPGRAAASYCRDASLPDTFDEGHRRSTHPTCHAQLIA